VRRRVPILVLALAGALPGLAPAGAHAYVRSTVEGDPSTPLFWRFRTVPLRLAPDSCDDLGGAAVELAIARSIATWNEAARGCSDFRLVDDGYPSGSATNLFDGEPDGENRILWRETVWPEEVPTHTLALTTSIHRVATGEIVDADIDLNGVHHTWTAVDDPAAARVDVENTVTHELGHLLGLAHVPDAEATMYGESAPGDLDKRSLAEDDVAGLCSVYPDGARTPGAPVYSGTPLTSGCVVRGAPGRPAPIGILAVGLGLLILRRRRGARRGAREGETACASTRGAGRPGAPSRARPGSPPTG
jgi:hypothetical protein